MNTKHGWLRIERGDQTEVVSGVDHHDGWNNQESPVLQANHLSGAQLRCTAL